MRQLIEIIELVQCPGCVGGPDPKSCEAFHLEQTYGGKCSAHVPGTSFATPVGFVTVSLGLPKGFNREANGATIRIWETAWPKWDHLNIPVWYFEEDDFVYVRTFVPRLGKSYVEVIQDKSVMHTLGFPAHDVESFMNDID